MIARCENPAASHYERYGGRGITVCERWRDSFENFIADMGEPPTRNHSIERADNDGNYEPRNCCWATRAEQMRNTRISTKITFNGQTRALSDWCDSFGILPNTFRSRLRYGWTVAKAFLTPINR